MEAAAQTPGALEGMTDEQINAVMKTNEVLTYYFMRNGGAGPCSKMGLKVFRAIEALFLPKLSGAAQMGQVGEPWKGPVGELKGGGPTSVEQMTDGKATQLPTPVYGRCLLPGSGPLASPWMEHWSDREAYPHWEPLYSESQVKALIAAVRDIAEMTNPDDPESYSNDDPSGCLEAVHTTASAALAPLPTTQEAMK